MQAISTPVPTDHTAKEALLEAAQRLFATQGFDSVSLRTLTQEAGVNLAAVNYHFGSKEGLIDALVANTINPVNEKRLKLLTEAEADGDPSVDTVLECFLRPVIEEVKRSAISEKLFFQMMGRCMNDRGLSNMPESTMALFGQVILRFPQALHRSLPHLDEAELLWRLHFTVGVLIHILIHNETLNTIAAGREGSPSPEGILAMVKNYCSAGLHAPTTTFPES